MPIATQDIITQVSSALDAEGSDRYLFDQDYKPAINYSIDLIVSAMSSIFSEKKYSGEALRELLSIGVWQSNKYSRVSINPADIGFELWSIANVYPEPNLHPSNSKNPLTNPVNSEFKPGKTFIDSYFSAERRNGQEWNDNRLNPFAPGNEVITNEDIKTYSYRDFTDYSSSSYQNSVPWEIEVRPATPFQYVAIELLKRPNKIVSASDSIQLPSSLINFMVQKSLNFISFKQGDGTNLYGVSREDMSMLIKLMS